MCAISMARNKGWISAAKDAFGIRFPSNFSRLCGNSIKLLGGYRLACGFCTRGDGAVKTVREKASLFHTFLASEREVKHLSIPPGRDQPVTDLNGEDLLCLSAGWRDQVHAIQRSRRYLQSRNLCSYGGSMLCFSAQKRCRGRNDFRSLKKTGRARVRRHADVL